MSKDPLGDESQSGKNWSRVADLYAKVVVEDDPLSTTARTSAEILASLNARHPLSKATFLIDMGCGTAPLTAALLKSNNVPPDARFVAADISQVFIDKTTARKQQRIEAGDSSWEKVEIRRWDGRNLSGEVKDNEVSHLLSSFCYFAMPDEKQGLAEALRVLKPGGIFVETSMGFTDWGHLPTFIKQVRPDKHIPMPGKHWESKSGVHKHLSDAGFKDVEAREYEISMALDKQQDAVNFVVEVFPFVKPMLGDMSDDEVRQVKQLMLEYVKQKHPKEPIRLKGTAVIGVASK